MINPLIVAQDMFKTGFNEVEAKRYEDAHKVFLKVIDKASEGLANFEDKKIDATIDPDIIKVPVFLTGIKKFCCDF